ncbi:SDR family NAD(P)-dependent oxidoreductase [Aidingimonas halophila]|uniref:Short-chain dehydrogenase n=1 Tax=Aidingimonas halophila TaxID=574349 RepID=A0A1H3CGZ3_9GAMM|nr:SDR family oxidoreductase [Aidingimonas halophila]GHC35468.1 20-beta-hydroxysteroid dehydrogenase [Aidingimonas halophila]SDX53482.1 Short-chain dehydrogenase [Aidingimonas halophila]
MSEPILVTGATGGVGRTICRSLHHRYQVLALGRDDSRLRELRDACPGIVTYCTDLQRADDLVTLIKRIGKDYPYIPYVVNNAGLNVKAEITSLDIESLEHSVRINAIAPFLIMKALIPAMQAHDFGRIVNITSGAPLNCFAGYAAYSASKAMLNALTVTAANENAEFDIKINLMSPGPVRSAMAPAAPMEPEVCLPTLDYLLGLDRGGPSGRFFWLGHELPLFPDLESVDWLQGTAGTAFPRIHE